MKIRIRILYIFIRLTSNIADPTDRGERKFVQSYNPIISQPLLTSRGAMLIAPDSKRTRWSSVCSKFSRWCRLETASYSISLSLSLTHTHVQDPNSDIQLLQLLGTDGIGGPITRLRTLNSVSGEVMAGTARSRRHKFIIKRVDKFVKRCPPPRPVISFYANGFPFTRAPIVKVRQQKLDNLYVDVYNAVILNVLS